MNGKVLAVAGTCAEKVFRDLTSFNSRPFKNKMRFPRFTSEPVLRKTSSAGFWVWGGSAFFPVATKLQ